MIYYAQGESHDGTIPGAGARLFHLELDPEQAGMTGARGRPGIPGQIEDEALRPIAGLMIRLRRECEEDDQCARLAREALALEALDRVARQRVARSEGASWLSRVRDSVHDRARESLSLGAIAGDVGRHPSHVARAFSDRFGCSIGAYQRRLRVADAARSIGAGASLSETAYRAGFADQAHLTRVFRAETGVTPGAYRREVRG